MAAECRSRPILIGWAWKYGNYMLMTFYGILLGHHLNCKDLNTVAVVSSFELFPFANTCTSCGELSFSEAGPTCLAQLVVFLLFFKVIVSARHYNWYQCQQCDCLSNVKLIWNSYPAFLLIRFKVNQEKNSSCKLIRLFTYLIELEFLKPTAQMVQTQCYNSFLCCPT